MKQEFPIEWSKNLTIYEVNIRQYSQEGTFRAFERDLPRIKELGIGIIWFMPIQPIGIKNRKGSLGSYYSIQNYHEINPSYGTLEEFKQLVKKIHESGMYVILDWVANHTAWDHHWSIDHPEFYSRDDQGNFRAPFSEWSDVMLLNYQKKELWNLMAEEMKFWIREADIDGFRCDMAHLVTTEFWNFARQELDKVKKVFMLAESENRDLLNDAFDMEYQWKMFHIINSIAKGVNCVWDIDNELPFHIWGFPRNRYQMLFTSNHDENAWNGSAIERLGYALETCNALVFTLDGMPLIYNGQEAGHYSRLHFFDKDMVIWKEDKLAGFYKKLIALKKRNKALWSGPYGGILQRVYTDNGHDILAYIREKDDDKIFVILNLSYSHNGFTLNGNIYCGEYTEVLTGEKATFKENTHTWLKPWEYKIYEKIS
jgi:glycosidase